MTDQPNLVAGDEEGTPLEDTDHLVNGRVPGKGSGYFTETSEGAVTPADGQPLSVGELNRTGYVNISDGPQEIQTRLSDNEEVVVYGDPSGVTWDETVEVPDGKTLDGTLLDGTIPVSQENLSTVDRNSGTYVAVVTTESHPGSDVTVRGFDFDCSGVSALNGGEDRYFGIWTDGRGMLIEDCTVDGMAVTSSDCGIVLSDDNDGSGVIRDSEGHNCGYDGIRLLGDCDGTEIVRCGGSGNDQGTIQLTRWVEGDSGQPTNVTFRECYGPRLYQHGYPSLGGINGSKYIDCETDQLHILGENEDVMITGGTIANIRWEANLDGGALSGLKIRDVQFDPADTTDYLVHLEHNQPNGTAESISLNGSWSTGGRMVRIRSYGDSSVTRKLDVRNNELADGSRGLEHTIDSGNPTFERVTFQSNTIEGTHNVIESNGEITNGDSITDFRATDNTYIDVNNQIDDETLYANLTHTRNDNW